MHAKLGRIACKNTGHRCLGRFPIGDYLVLGTGDWRVNSGGVDMALGPHTSQAFAERSADATRNPAALWRDGRIWLEHFRRTKIYDLGVALPFIAWILFRLQGRWPVILHRTQELIDGNINSLQLLQLIGRISSLVFSFLLIYLFIARKTPERKSKGLLPRVVAICGTFSVAAFLFLNGANLSLPVQFLATLLTVTGTLGSVIAAARLGRSFSLLPEARQLVTSGPYALMRHPLYLAEMIGILGATLQYQQPWALMLGSGAIAMLYWRTVFEERVLTQAYPEYAAYTARTRRFIPYVF